MNIYCALLKCINIPLRATKLPKLVFRKFFYVLILRCKSKTCLGKKILILINVTGKYPLHELLWNIPDH